MPVGSKKTLVQYPQGQSTIEFALILPLMVLFVVGIFELRRAFFAYITISNAAREGMRIYTFAPDTTSFAEINQTVTTEISPHTWVPEESGVATSIFHTAAQYTVGENVTLPVFNKICDHYPNDLTTPETLAA